jgi:hypothetical protein
MTIITSITSSLSNNTTSMHLVDERHNQIQANLTAPITHSQTSKQHSTRILKFITKRAFTIIIINNNNQHPHQQPTKHNPKSISSNPPSIDSFPPLYHHHPPRPNSSAPKPPKASSKTSNYPYVSMPYPIVRYATYSKEDLSIVRIGYGGLLDRPLSIRTVFGRWIRRWTEKRENCKRRVYVIWHRVWFPWGRCIRIWWMKNTEGAMFGILHQSERIAWITTLVP